MNTAFRYRTVTIGRAEYIFQLSIVALERVYLVTKSDEGEAIAVKQLV